MLEVNRLGRSRVHEAHCRARSMTELDPADAAALAAIERLTHLAPTFPGEHCTECAAPDCHSSCDLFQRAPTGLCRRFADGIVVRWPTGGPFACTMEVLFKEWGRLLCVGNTWCVSRPWYWALSTVLVASGRLSSLLQAMFRFLPSRTHWRITDKIRGLGNRIPRLLNHLAARGCGTPATNLLAVIGNPGREPVTLEIALSGFGDSQGGRSWRHATTVPHGWHVVSIPITAFAPVIDVQGLFRISLVPLIERPTLLQVAYFGFAASLEAPAAAPDGAEPMTQVADDKTAPKIKALVVDLDNTLWDGIVLEDPAATYALKPGVADVLAELDRRGILLSIASKNNADDVRPILERQGIWDLFLHPQISWQAKSVSIEAIVRQLNIGMDTVAFIDDSEFERAEVGASLPAVRVYDATQLIRLVERDEFTVPVTVESQRRRQLYREEQDRTFAFEESSGSYADFLVSCQIRLGLEEIAEQSMERVQELVQRTNQLNYSGNRYTRTDLSRILERAGVVPVVIRCEDRFGSYGIVGFSLLQVVGDGIEIKDLMLSCRVQGKQIEHAFLSHLVQEAAIAGWEQVTCHYVRTARNAAAARVFEDLEFRRDGRRGNSETYVQECATWRHRRFPATVVDDMRLGARLSAARP